MSIESTEKENNSIWEELDSTQDELSQMQETIKVVENDKKKTEDLKREEKKEKNEFIKSYERRVELGRAKMDLEKLRFLVERGVLTQDILNTILKEEIIITDDIEEIFQKIDEILEMKDIDKYLPEEYRLSKEEYVNALKNDNARLGVIWKLDKALVHIYNQSHPDQWGLDMFSSIYLIFDKNLKLVQENTIDIKDSLEEDMEESLKETSKETLWQQVTGFFGGSQ